jgi:hypothetical protein
VATVHKYYMTPQQYDVSWVNNSNTAMPASSRSFSTSHCTHTQHTQHLTPYYHRSEHSHFPPSPPHIHNTTRGQVHQSLSLLECSTTCLLTLLTLACCRQIISSPGIFQPSHLIFHITSQHITSSKFNFRLIFALLSSLCSSFLA